MNKYEAENYLLDKYKSLIYEYSDLYAKELKDRNVGRINIARAVLKSLRIERAFLLLILFLIGLDSL